MAEVVYELEAPPHVSSLRSPTFHHFGQQINRLTIAPTNPISRWQLPQLPSSQIMVMG